MKHTNNIRTIQCHTQLTVTEGDFNLELEQVTWIDVCVDWAAGCIDDCVDCTAGWLDNCRYLSATEWLRTNSVDSGRVLTGLFG